MPIEITDLVPIGRGVQRPEQVVVTSDGRVFASDRGSAVAEILGENKIRRIGNAGGEPDGIAVDACLTRPTRQRKCLRRLPKGTR
jgi:hypothetical protein